MKKINLSNIEKNFAKLKVLNDVSLEVDQGEVVSVIGPSGSGKSTLLRCLVGLESIDRGIIEIDGTVLKENNKVMNKMGMVFQEFNLFPHKTVIANLIEAPIVVNKLEKNKAKLLAENMLRKVGLFDKKDAYPSQLSGGQKQRVAIARALAIQPEILLFDEPTSALDPELVGEVLTVIKQLTSENITMLIVTHEMAFAREVSDRIVFMDKGKIIADSDPGTMFSVPGHNRIESFLEKML